MRGSLIALIRLSVFVTLGLTTLAIGLGRTAARGPSSRTWMPARAVYVNHFTCLISGRDTRFLDGESGRVVRLGLPDGEVLEHASRSPWRDETGRSQVIGRWSSRVGPDGLGMTQAYGLARVSYPDGKVLDRIEADAVPNSPPCWFPNLGASVLYSSGDGGLHRASFESDGLEAPSGRLPAPVGWAVRPPGEGPVMMTDPCWPDGTDLGGRVLVAMSVQESDDRGRRYRPPKLWWVQLDPEGGQIVAADRLTDPGRPGADETSERLPSVGRVGGRPVLVYLARDAGERSWSLKGVPLQPGGPGVAPRLIADQGRTLAEGCVLSSPVTSADGLRVAFIRRDEGGRPVVARVPLASDALGPAGVASGDRGEGGDRPVNPGPTGGATTPGRRGPEDRATGPWE